jgi:secreted Zn-dependent insulinase-like peptidase
MTMSQAGRRLAAGLVLSLLVTACAGTRGAPSTASGVAVQAAAPQATLPSPVIRKPVIDSREYRFLALANGVRVLLVADAQADKSAASLLVESGSYDEPADRPGLAHFLEHMLFLGTAKYPEADGYQAFIATHGGTHNAYTSADHTNYFFDIAPGQFDAALDRFAQFFVAPTFAAEYVQREMNAVDSEYRMQLREDAWRGNAVQRVALSPQHPASRFTIGSLQTLSDRDGASTRHALLEFYANHYDPSQMIVALYGPHTLDELARMAATHFAAIPARTPRGKRVARPLMPPDSGPRRLAYRPVRDTRVLTFTFPLPSVDAYARENPTAYLASLIGHEGEGSLHAWLESRGWIQSLGASAGRIDAANAVFEVEIELTEAGLAHVEDIGAALFGYVALVRREGIRADRYAEESKLAALAFDYADPRSPTSTVTTLTRNLMQYPPEDALRGGAIMERFDEALIRRFLDAIRVDDVLVGIAAPDVETRDVEPYFEVPYALDPLPQAWQARWRAASVEPAFAIPAPNPFVPDDLTLVAGGSTPAPAPRRTDDATGATLWHLADASFGAPRANVVVHLLHCTRRAPADVAYATLYASLVQDALNTYAYPATLAGLAFQIDVDGGGLRVTVTGYEDKQHVLLAAVMEALATHAIRADRFGVLREKLLEDWANVIRDRPASQAVAELGRLVNRPSSDPAQLIAALTPATPAMLAAWRDRALAGTRIEMFAHGNLASDEAAALLAAVTGRVPPRDCTPPPRDVLAVTAPHARSLDIPHDDTALVFYVQGTSRSDAERARFGLLAHMLREPYFTALRTEQQLGYLVTVTPAVFRRVPGTAFVVQSPVAPAGKVLAATRAFLAAQADAFAALDDAAFAAVKDGFLARLLARDRNLTDRTQRLAQEIDDDVFTFDTRERIAAEIRRISADDMRAFLGRFLELARHRTLVVHSAGRFADQPESRVDGAAIADREAFQAGLQPIPE